MGGFFIACLFGTRGENMIFPCHSKENSELNL